MEYHVWRKKVLDKLSEIITTVTNEELRRSFSILRRTLEYADDPSGLGFYEYLRGLRILAEIYHNDDIVKDIIRGIIPNSLDLEEWLFGK